MDVPANLKFTREHEWVREEGDDVITMGITSFAQDALGDIVYFEAPPEGMEVESGVEFCVVESVKAVSDVYAPVSGEIVGVNENVVDASWQAITDALQYHLIETNVTPAK